MADVVVSTLIGQLEGAHDLGPDETHVDIKPELIVRASTARAPTSPR
jgi:DNA-binding LacI/PurR family transcriptional regulator